MTYDQSIAEQQFAEHGEIWLQDRLTNRLKTIFDVGANIGEWARMARKRNPQATIHMFEIASDTFCQLLSNIDIDSLTIPNGFGLGNETQFIEMQYAANNPELTTQFKRLILNDAVIRTGLVVTGDDYVKSRNIDYIDFLKIDVEGAEGNVLQGFEQTLQQRRIGIIQFEYSYHAILSRWLLVDSYDLLTPLGYRLGKLTPNGIEFHAYTYWYEKFPGCDYVAVHESCQGIFN